MVLCGKFEDLFLLVTPYDRLGGIDKVSSRLANISHKEEPSRIGKVYFQLLVCFKPENVTNLEVRTKFSLVKYIRGRRSEI